MAKYNTALTILAVLQKCSDSDNRLTQREISELIEQKYGDKIDRETIRRGIDDIIQVGFPVKYKSIIRKSNIEGIEIKDVITDLYYEKG